MKIFVKNLKGDIITLEVESSDTFADLKAKIREKIGIRPDLRVEFVTGKELEDGWALVDCNIQNESTFDLLDLRIIGRRDNWLCFLPGEPHKIVRIPCGLSSYVARSDPPEEPAGKPQEGREAAAPTFSKLKKYIGARSATRSWHNHPQRCLSEEPPAQPTPIPPEAPPAQPTPTPPEEPPAQPTPIPPIQHWAAGFHSCHAC